MQDFSNTPISMSAGLSMRSKKLGALDNTLVYYIIGDNGASAEGTINGAFNEMANFNGLAAIETPEFMAEVKDKFGTKDAYNHYSVGWAWACVPRTSGRNRLRRMGWHSQRDDRALACRDSDQGGDAVAVHPRHRRRTDDPRSCETTGTDLRQRRPAITHRGDQHGLHLDDAEVAERHDLQYFEMAGNRGIYYKGWSAVTRHSTPWLFAEALPALDDDVWELYDGSQDWTQSKDLAAEMPEKLAALQRLWLIEAVKYNVLPIDDRRFERFNPHIAGRPQLVSGNRQVLFPGMKRLSEHSVLSIKNRSFSVTAAVDVADGITANGVMIAQGGRFGGWALYAREGRAKFVYNLLGHDRVRHRFRR